MPQPPQFAALVLVLISQPSESLSLLQSPKPALQVPLHRPPPQLMSDMLLLEHMTLQPPQLAGSTPVWISQPSVRLLLLQSTYPERQVPEQLPVVQVSVAMPATEQAVPQPPQLFGSLPVAISQPSVNLFALQSL